MRYLNLYAAIGGNIELVDDTEHEIVNVELNEEIAEVLIDRKPNQKVVIADAHQYLLDHFDEFDFIWSSPPCQTHSRMNKFTRHKLLRYPDMRLYEEIIFLQNFYKGKWVVENVIPYYQQLIESFKIGRHLFWSNFSIGKIENEPKSPKNMINGCTVDAKKVMMDWLGIHYEKNIYYGSNHCPAQVLRNCVHPVIGKHVFDCSLT